MAEGKTLSVYHQGPCSWHQLASLAEKPLGVYIEFVKIGTYTRIYFDRPKASLRPPDGAPKGSQALVLPPRPPKSLPALPVGVFFRVCGKYRGAAEGR